MSRCRNHEKNTNRAHVDENLCKYERLVFTSRFPTLANTALLSSLDPPGWSLQRRGFEERMYCRRLRVRVVGLGGRAVLRVRGTSKLLFSGCGILLTNERQVSCTTTHE